jgi:hypothetical protein
MSKASRITCNPVHIPAGFLVPHELHVTTITSNLEVFIMGMLRGGIAGLAAWKWGGGCLGTIIVFLIVYWLLGMFGMR